MNDNTQTEERPELDIDAITVESDMAYLDGLLFGRVGDEVEDEELQEVTNIVSIWKNPKSKTINKKELEVGQLVTINDKALGYEITNIDNEDITLTNSIKHEDIEEVITIKDEGNIYPLFTNKDNSDIRVGNIIVYGGADNYGVITKVVSETEYKVKGESELIAIQDISRVLSREQPKERCEEFECGAIEYKGKIFKDKEELESKYEDVKFQFKTHKYTAEVSEIAKEYNVDVSTLKPKEISILAKLRTVLYHPLSIEKRRWACLFGPSGTGKTEVAVKCAELMNVEYILYQGNAQVTVDDLKGYKSITTGEYFGSLLRDAVEHGKMFIIDEMDACNPNTLIALNSLKRDYYQFEDKEIKVHKDFRLVATANTLELSEEYSARMPVDLATKARFKLIEYKMETAELAIRYGLKYIKQIKNIDRITAREVDDLVVDMRILEDIAVNNTEGWEV